MAKIVVPPVKFAPELHGTKALEALKAAGATRGELHHVPIENIRVMDGFNARVRETDDYQAHKAHLGAMILANGYDNSKPLSGFAVEQDGDKIIYLKDGHTRLEAVNDIVNPALGDEPMKTLPVVVSGQPDLVELNVNLIQSNSGRELTPFEKGLVVKRLMGLNLDKKQIAEKLGYTTRYIDDLLVIVGAPAKVRDLILTGQITSTNALKTLRKDPAKAAEVLTAAVERAKARGKTVAAPKDSTKTSDIKMVRKSFDVSLATGDAMGAVLKSIAAQIRGLVAHDKGEGDLLQTDGQITVTVNVPEPTKPKSKPRKTKTETPAPTPAEETPPATEPTPGEGADSGTQTETSTGDADLSDL